MSDDGLDRACDSLLACCEICVCCVDKCAKNSSRNPAPELGCPQTNRVGVGWNDKSSVEESTVVNDQVQMVSNGVD